MRRDRSDVPKTRGLALNIREQIDSGILVCPKTKKKLIYDGRTHLVTEDRKQRYEIYNGNIPVLLDDPESMGKYRYESEEMNKRYSAESIEGSQSFRSRMMAKLRKDYRSKGCRDAFNDLFENITEESICLSIGGGPTRAHLKLINLNIGPFPNVDVISDAHSLPYADNSVDIIHSEAVVEHLYDPAKAASEMFRVLKPSGKCYVCTPFMQAFHGFPHHYQNYTIVGHRKLFHSAGFEVVSYGTCVGPVFTITNLIHVFIREYFPQPINYPSRVMWVLLSSLIKPLDRVLNKKHNSHILASTTYLALKKT